MAAACAVVRRWTASSFRQAASASCNLLAICPAHFSTSPCTGNLAPSVLKQLNRRGARADNVVIASGQGQHHMTATWHIMRYCNGSAPENPKSIQRRIRNDFRPQQQSPAAQTLNEKPGHLQPNRGGLTKRCSAILCTLVSGSGLKVTALPKICTPATNHSESADGTTWYGTPRGTAPQSQ